MTRHNTRDIFPATGTELSAKSWLTEAPLRMLMNNLHPDVAENPHELVVYGGIGRAARTWEDFDRIVGLQHLRAIHLNDSKTDLGSRVDRHDHIGHGKLGMDCFKMMLKKFPDVPKVLETEKEDDWDEKNLTLLRSC